MKASEKIQNDWNTVGKATYSLRELRDLLNEYGGTEEKLNFGDVREIMRGIGQGQALTGKNKKDVFEHPAVLVAIRKWEGES